MKFKPSRRILLLSIVPLLALGFFAFDEPEDLRFFEINRNITIFSDIFKEINRSYVEDINVNKLMKTGIEEMLASLDPYTNYIPEDRIEDYRTMTTGQYGGIGSIIGKRKGKTMVLMPYKGFPAEKSGLKIGDVITKIDGIAIEDKNTSEVSKLLKGQAGTEVTLEIERYGKEKPMEVQLKREKIKIDNVPYHGMVTDEIGYLQLSDFTQKASDEVSSAIKDLKEQGAKKIIFDLRGNPGGLLNEAIDISNLFIDKGLDVVSTRSKVEEWNKTYKALNAPLDTYVPLAVLINGRSASASEIVSGVIQDYDRGVLLGKRSYGKGLVQATRPLSYNSQLKITIAKYYIPSGRCIQAIDYSNDGKKVPDSLRTEFKTQNGRKVFDGKGIKPDIVVEDPVVAPISASLVSKGHLFDYATKFFYENDSIEVPKNFHLSDEQYANFVEWVSDKEYDYQTRAEKELDDLIKSAKKDKYYETITDEIDNIQQQIGHNKENDLQIHREEIQELLEKEIVSRFYLRRGIKESSFDNDPVLKAAIDVLNDEEKYQGILDGTVTIDDPVDMDEDEIDEEEFLDEEVTEE